MIGLCLLLFGVILVSAILSLVEAAILSLPLARARVLSEESRRNANDVLYIKENIHYSIASIVIVNNAVNIAGSIFIGQRVTVLFGDQWLGIAAAGVAFCVIVFGEVIPKTLGERYRVSVALFFAKPTRLLVWVFQPFVKFILKIDTLIVKNLNRPKPRVTEEEIKMMLKLGRDSGTVEMDEEALCNRVFKLNDLRADTHKITQQLI